MDAVKKMDKTIETPPLSESLRLLIMMGMREMELGRLGMVTSRTWEAMGGREASKPASRGWRGMKLGCVGVRGRNMTASASGHHRRGSRAEVTTRNYRNFPFRDVLGLRCVWPRMPVTHFAKSPCPFFCAFHLFPIRLQPQTGWPCCANFWVRDFAHAVA